MDQILKSRKMASVFARRQKIDQRERQEREEEETADIMSAATRQQKIKILLDTDSDFTASRKPSTSTDILNSPTHEPGYDSSTSDSPSEDSPKTPDGIPLPPAGKKRPPPLRLNTQQHPASKSHGMADDLAELPMPPSLATLGRSSASSSPLTKPSLVTLADWNYDRYSAVMDSPRSAKAVGNEPHESYSPIEVATPVSYQLPKARPAMVKLINIGSKPKAQSPRLTTTDSNLRPMSTQPLARGFPAAEATPVDFSGVEDRTVEIRPTSNRIASSLLSRHKPALDRKRSEPLLSASYRMDSAGGLRTSTVLLRSIPGPLSSHPSNDDPPVSAVDGMGGAAPPIKPKSRLRQISNPRALPSAFRNLNPDSEIPPVPQRSSTFPLPNTYPTDAAAQQQPPTSPFTYTPTTALPYAAKYPHSASTSPSRPLSALHVARKKSMTALSQTFKSAKDSISRLSISQSQSQPQLQSQFQFTISNKSSDSSIPNVPAFPAGLTINTAKANRAAFEAVKRRVLQEPALPPTPRITDTKAIWMGASSDHGLSRKASTGRRRPKTSHGSGGSSSRGSGDKHATADADPSWVVGANRYAAHDMDAPMLPGLSGIKAGWEGERRGGGGSAPPSKVGSRPASSHLR